MTHWTVVLKKIKRMAILVINFAMIRHDAQGHQELTKAFKHIKADCFMGAVVLTEKDIMCLPHCLACVVFKKESLCWFDANLLFHCPLALSVNISLLTKQRQVGCLIANCIHCCVSPPLARCYIYVTCWSNKMPRKVRKCAFGRTKAQYRSRLSAWPFLGMSRWLVP